MTSRLSPRLLSLAAVAALVSAGTARAADTAAVPPQSQLINEKLSAAWKAAELKPSKKASDYEFVRRVFVDIIGRIPTAEEVRDFAEGGNNRPALIHRLLYEKDYKPRFSERTNPKDPKTVVSYDYAGEYARNFSNIWGVWLMTRGGVAEVYHESIELWLEEQFSKNTPWNEVVKQLITATGKTNDNGAVCFIMSHLGEAVPREARDGRPLRRGADHLASHPTVPRHPDQLHPVPRPPVQPGVEAGQLLGRERILPPDRA